MVSLLSYLLAFLAILFWMFRIAVVLMYQLDMDFFAVPLNVNQEIGVLFLTIPCLILVFRRNIVGAAAYFGLYLAYFGQTLYDAVVESMETGFDLINSMNMLFVLVGILIPFLTFLDILFNKNRTLGKGTKKTDWFFKNDAFDREYDERADRNQYKI